ncbi:response regulator [Merismopedia glauca]|uniref:Response regulator n=1 Tax=Merismopedia glauca CCAP 1448/3 TaxID=1296344 RepID=A0A2T1BWI1_9CYAN|nr:response regulator [Merismopedia glauca]PSB00361.1 response regulator [Merismopedia glauca CCAP 1448/3]
MNTQTSLKAFQFQPHELPQKLLQHSEPSQNGYWEFRLRDTDTVLYLAIACNRVVFAGNRRLSWSALLQGLQRYVTLLRTPASREAIAALEKNTEHETLSKTLHILENTIKLSHQLVIDALQSQILMVCDQIWEGAGFASFIPDLEPLMQTPISGMSLESLVTHTHTRHQDWSLLKAVIPSMEAIPILNPTALAKSNLSPEQKQQIEKLTGLGKSLNTVAQITAKDPLVTAKTFANLVRSGLVSLQIPSELAPKKASQPELFIVDDSPIFLQQFRSLVSSWGYKVNVCSTTETAVETAILLQPDVIFLDINMPGLSGFDLIKAMRREAQLTQKKLVLLTAENSLSNQWRAKWGNCKFLAKPRTPEDIQSFQVELKQLLNEKVTLAA